MAARRQPTVVSLFSGAGGLDYGFEAAGFENRVAIEMDHDCCETLRANRPWTVIESPIEEVSSKNLLRAAKCRLGAVDVLIGGPPCQPFSKSGYWARGDSKRLADPRARTLQEYMRCVADLLPRVFVLENVHGINYSGKEEGFRALEKMAEDINRDAKTDYKLSWAVLNAADYGVPQQRVRFFLVGDREGRSFEFPPATHATIDGLQQGQLFGARPTQSHVTAWDAIGGLEPDPSEALEVRGRWADLLPSIPEGQNYLWHTDRGGGKPLFGWRTRYWSFLLKLAKNRPSWTIQAQPGPAIGPFHWESRRLSQLELARLQTFPEGLRVAGSRNAVQKQLGNAVPSLLAEILGRAIRRQLLGYSRSQSPLLAVPLRRPIPPAERVRGVSRKFLSLVGEHAAHPGTGLGRAARERLEGGRPSEAEV
ncbi:MAG: DNA cytosine methyltransferase [Hyphomicrobium sp.]